MFIALAMLISYLNKPGLESIIHNQAEIKAYQAAINDNNMTQIEYLAKQDSDNNKTKYDLIMQSVNDAITSEQKKKERLLPKVREHLRARIENIL